MWVLWLMSCHADSEASWWIQSRPVFGISWWEVQKTENNGPFFGQTPGKWILYLALPWHNHNGWLDVKHQVAYILLFGRQVPVCGPFWKHWDEGVAYTQKSLRCRLLGDAACALLTALCCYSNWTLIVLGLFSGLLDFARFIQMCCLYR